MFPVRGCTIVGLQTMNGKMTAVAVLIHVHNMVDRTLPTHPPIYKDSKRILLEVCLSTATAFSAGKHIVEESTFFTQKRHLPSHLATIYLCD